MQRLFSCLRVCSAARLVLLSPWWGPCITGGLKDVCVLRRTLKELTLRSDQTDLVFGCSHISQPVLQHLACCPQLRQLNITSAELMAVDLSALSYLTALEVGFEQHA